MTIESLATQEYKHGFVTDIESESLPPGLDEDVVRYISAKKGEPEWLLEWRLKAYRHWLTMDRTALGQRLLSALRLSENDLLRRAQTQKSSGQLWTKSIPNFWTRFNKLGISLDEQKRLVGRGGGRGFRFGFR